MSAMTECSQFKTIFHIIIVDHWSTKPH